MKKLLAAAIIAFSPVAGYSAATINLQITELLNASSQPISAGSIGVFVVDQNSDGLTNPGDARLSVGQLFGADNIIVGVDNASDVNGDGHIGFDASILIDYTASLSIGDRLYFVWFPTIQNEGTTVGNNLPYGTFTSALVADGSDISWAVPADGTYGLYAYDTNQSGSFAPAQFVANLTTIATSNIPEPSTYAAFAGAVILGVACLRKRRVA
jgi:hypothetical protein